MRKLFESGLVKSAFVIFCLLSIQFVHAEGTRELLVNKNQVYDSTKFKPSEFYGVQIWDQSDVRRMSGTYDSEAAANQIYRIKVRICNVGEVINLGFNQPNFDVFYRLYKPDGTTVQFNDNTVALAGDAGPSIVPQGNTGDAIHTYRVPRLYTITAASNTNPIVITTSGSHEFVSGNTVSIRGVLGNTNANGTYVVNVTSANQFQLLNVGTLTNRAGNGAYTSGGNVFGAGYANYYSEAAVGPRGGEASTIGTLPASYATKSGYRPLQHIADQIGDYYIVFNSTSADAVNRTKRIFSIFDITVWNNIGPGVGTRVQQKGRLYCAAWDINCGSNADPSAQFNARLFFYSADSVVTAVRFNQMRPYGFAITANSRGCANVSTAENDRKSRVLFNGFPEYPIFLNSPVNESNLADFVCGFQPKSSFGNVDTVFITGCHNDRCINIRADKSAQVGITILPDTGFNFTPRVLPDQTVLADQNTCIPWDGLDGAGQEINGQFTILVNYYNGLTNLPLFDVEEHRFGYRIELIAPAANPGAKNILVYWDDRPPASETVQDFVTGEALDGYHNFPPGSQISTNIGDAAALNVKHSTFNFFGCDPSIDHNAGLADVQGCHLWASRGANSATAPDNIFETHNTWWNANVILKEVSFYPSNIEVYAMRSHAPVAAGGSPPFAGTPNDTLVCSNIDRLQLNPIVRRENDPVPTGTFVAHPGRWTVVSGDGTFQSTGTATSSTLNDFYVFGPTDISTGRAVLRITSDSTSLTPCGNATDTLEINIIPGPAVNGGLPQTVCLNNNSAIVTLNGSISGTTTTFRWVQPAGVTGTFVPNPQTLNATYQPPASITSAPTVATSITLTLISLTNSGAIACPADSSPVVITYNAIPLVDAVVGAPACNTTSNIPVSATINGASSTAGFTIAWSGAGTIANGNTLNPTYTPTAGERSSGSANVRIDVTKTSAPACNAVFDVATITLTAPPTVGSGNDFSYCRNRKDTIGLSGTATGAATTTWTCVNCSGGSFMGTQNSLIAKYDPSAADLAQSSLRFVLTATSATCPPVRDTIEVTFTSPPTVTVPGLTSTCLNDPCVDITATVTGTGTGVWTKIFVAGGTFTPSVNSTSITYCLSDFELNQGNTGIVYSVTSNDCEAVGDTAIILIQNAPKPFAGIDKTVCINNAIDTLNDATSAAGTVTWASLSASPGIFNFSAPFSITRPRYSLSATEIAAGSATLVMTSTEGTCAPESDTVTIFVTGIPTVNAGTDINVCINNPVTNISGTASAGTTSWSYVSGITGTIGNPALISTTFTANSPTASGTTTLRLTTTLSGCNAVSEDVIISYTDVPVVTVTPGAPISICKTNPNVDISATFSAPATGIVWSKVSGGTGGTFSPKADSINATYIPSVSDMAVGTVVLRATSSGQGNCNAVNSTNTVVINYLDPPTASAGSNVTICENNASAVSITGSFSSVVSGQAWTSSSGCAACFADASLTNTTYTPSATDIGNGSVLLTLSSTGGPNGCTPVQSSMSIFINKAPSVDAGPDLVVCTNQNTVSLNGSASNNASVTWSIITGAGSFTSTSTAVTTYNISATDKTNGTAILRLTSNGNAGCANMPDDLIINFTDLPVVEAGLSRTVCANDLPIQLDASGSVGVWSTATAGVFTPGATIANATFQPSSTLPATINFTYSVSATGGCPAVSDVVTFTLIAAPTVNPTSNTYGVCSANATNVVVSAAPSTGAGFWITSGTGSFGNTTANNTTYTPSAADFSAGSVILTFETTNNGFCSAVVDTAKVFLTDMTLTAGPNQNMCGTAGTVLSLPATLLVNGASRPDLISGWSDNGLNTVTGTSPASYTVAAGEAPVAPATTVLNFTVNSSAVGACPALNANVAITLNAAPVVTPSAAANACETATSIPVSGTIVGAPSGSWQSSGGGIFSPNNVFNAAQLSVNYIPAASDTTLANITFTLTTDATLCGNVSQNVVVVLNNQFRVNAGNDDTLCANNKLYDLNGTITGVAGANGVWKSSSACVACFVGGTTFSAATDYDANTTDIGNGFVTLTLTSSAMGGNACPADSDKVVLRYTTGPDVNAGLNKTVCGNNTVVSILGSVNAPFTAQWSTTTGSFGSATNVMANNYILSNVDTTAGLANVILTSVDPTGLCAPDDDTITITITDAPEILSMTPRTICADTFFVQLDANTNLSANPIGSWSTTTGTGTFLNANATSDTAVYAPSVDDRNAAPQTIFLVYTTASGYCLPVKDSLALTISAAPTISINEDTVEICANQNSISTLTATSSTGSVLWTTSGTGNFAGSPTSTLANPTYTLSAFDKAAGTVTLSAFTTNNGTCFSARDQVKILIQALPLVEAGANVTICQNVTSVSLADASVLNAGGGVWTNTGVATGVVGPINTSINGTYFPSVCCFANIDTAQTSVTIRLTSTDNGLCPAAFDDKIITFTKLPLVTAVTAIDTICADNMSVQLTATTTRSSGITWTALDGGTFSASNSILNPMFNATATGTFRAVATAAGNGTCGPARDTVSITVRTVPTIDLGLPTNICSVGDDPTQTFQVASLSLTNATGVSWSSATGGSFDLSNPLQPVYTVSAQDLINGVININAITTAGIGTCQPASDQLTITINKAPIAFAGPDMQLCANTGAFPVSLSGTITHSNTGSWSTTAGSLVFSDPNSLTPSYTISNPEDIAGATVDIILTAIGTGACGPVDDTLTITYIANPVLNAGSDLQACFTSAADLLSFQLNAGGGLPGTWTTADDPSPTFTPNANTANATYTPSLGEMVDNNSITLTFTTTDVCYVTDPSDDIIVTIRENPLLNTTATPDICETSTTQALTTAITQGVTGVQWTILDGFGTLTNAATANATYNVNANDKNLDSIVVLVTTNSAVCPQDIDTISFNVIPAPSVNAGPDQEVCSDLLNVANAIHLSGSGSNAASFLWSSGEGAATTPASLISDFTVTTAFPATITLTAIGNAPCANVNQALIVTAVTAPVVSVLANKDTCAKLSPINLSSVFDGTTINTDYTTAGWTVVQRATMGSFVPDSSTIMGQYIPSAADTARGFVDLMLIATNTGVCTNSYSDIVRFTLDPQPVVSAGIDLTFCAQNKQIFIDASASGALGGITWETTGSGSFNPVNDTTTVYNVSSADSLNGGTILFIRTTNAPAVSCPDDTDFVSVVLTPAPVAIVNAGFDKLLCSDNISANLNGFILNATGGLWKVIKGSGTLSDSSDLNAKYFFSEADRLEDTLVFSLQSVGQDALCQPTLDTMLILFGPRPQVSPAAIGTVCASSPLIQLGDTIIASGGGIGRWVANGGDGIFTPNEFTIDAQYTPGPNDISAGRVGFTLISTNNGTCIDTYSADTSTIITPFTDASANASGVVCANSSGVLLNATSTTGEGFWDVLSDDGTDTETNIAGTSTLFVPGPADIANEMAMLRFYTTNSGCDEDSVQVLVAVKPAPTVQALPDLTVCADVINTGIPVQGNITIASSGKWRSTGTGTFSLPTSITSGGVTTVSATYFPSVDDTTSGNGAINLILESTGNVSGTALCDAEDDTISITVMPAPVVVMSAASPCATDAGVQLNGFVTQDATFYPAAYGEWTTSGTGVFAPDAFDPAAQYIPSATELAASGTSIVIRWKSIGAGSCNEVVDSINMFINIPLADAGVDQFTCNSADVTLTALADPNGANYDWEVMGTPGSIGTGLAVLVSTAATESYVMTMTDKFGCQAADTVTVTSINTPVLNISTDQCYDYYLYLNLEPQPTNLNPQGTIQWSFNNLVVSGVDEDSIRVQSPGVYSVIYSLGACQLDYGDHTVFDIPRILTPDVIGCTNTLVSVLVNPIYAPADIVSFTWTDTLGNAQGAGNPRNLMSSAVDFDTITYFVQVTDVNGCSVNDSTRLISVPVPVPFLTSDSMECQGTAIVLDATIAPSNISSLIAYGLLSEWYEASTPATILGTNTNISLNANGTYVYRGTVGQCIGDDTTILLFQPYPVSGLPTDTTLCMEKIEELELDAGVGVTGVPELTDLNYDWTGFGTTVADTNRLFTVLYDYFTNNKSEDNTYVVDITAVYDYLQCSTQVTSVIHDVCEPRVFPPTAFHPGDPNSMDAFFTIQGKYFKEFSLKIFNRWGEVIFESDNVENSWDGSYRGEIMPVGVYAYTVSYVGKSDEFSTPITKEGRIVLIR